MRTRVIVLALFVVATASSSQIRNPEFLRNDSIGNDPSREKLCIARGNLEGKTAPFEIDMHYVESARKSNPEATFVVEDSTAITELVECIQNSVTGQFGPYSDTPENKSVWRLITPPRFDPSIQTYAGAQIVENLCMKAARDKANRADFDHISQMISVFEINLHGGPLYHPGVFIGGVKAERYDVDVEGTLLYRSSGPDLFAIQVNCLFSPMLEMKAIQLK